MLRIMIILMMLNMTHAEEDGGAGEGGVSSHNIHLSVRL